MITTSYGSKHLETTNGDDSCIPYDLCPKADKHLTELWDKSHSYIIVEAPTGRFYTNQTHGVACCHPLVEGFLAKLPNLTVPHVGCWGGLTEEGCKLVDAVISKYGISVDRSRIEMNCDGDWGEAWIPVTGSMRGILTYPNCD